MQLIFRRLIQLSKPGVFTSRHLYLNIRASMSTGCCPPTAWGKLEPDANYKDKGTVEKLEGIDVYRVGKAGAAGQCILWNYDIFGFDSGRTRQLCDQLADKGYLVIMPDWYRGKMQDPAEGMDKVVSFIKDNTDWESMKKDFYEKIKPHAEKHGAKIYGTIGTCWGTYPVVRFSADPVLFKAGVSMHPSHPPVISMMGENQEEILRACKEVRQLFMPAGDDPEDVYPGGIAEKILGSNASFVEFKEMSHGWTTRGDINDAKVEPEVRRAMAEAASFFQANLK